ncbi:MAG: helix-turn-helix domain-containing protein [Boseongicola sp.]|nr:helix-turn-helix domain-containing protein [Boseongicola sp.]
MRESGTLFQRFCFAQASFESSRHVYRREHGPGQVRRFFNTSFTAFELRRYMMNFYFSKGSFTISELVEVSEFSRPTVTSTVHEALELGYLEELSGTGDRRRRDFRPTEPMLEAWRNYCNALLANPEFSRVLKLAQALMSMRELEAQPPGKDM